MNDKSEVEWSSGAHAQWGQPRPPVTVDCGDREHRQLRIMWVKMYPPLVVVSLLLALVTADSEDTCPADSRWSCALELWAGGLTSSVRGARVLAPPGERYYVTERLTPSSYDEWTPPASHKIVNKPPYKDKFKPSYPPPQSSYPSQQSLYPPQQSQYPSQQSQYPSDYQQYPQQSQYPPTHNPSEQQYPSQSQYPQGQNPPQQSQYPQQDSYPSQQSQHPGQLGSNPSQQSQNPSHQGQNPSQQSQYPQQGSYPSQQSQYPSQQGSKPSQQSQYPLQSPKPSQQSQYPQQGPKPSQQSQYPGGRPPPPVDRVDSPPPRKEVTETDLYLLAAIEKLVHRADVFEKRLRKVEETMHFIVAGKDKPPEPCLNNFTRVSSGCYWFSKEAVDWKTAANDCRKRAAALIELDAVAERRQLAGYTQKDPALRDTDWWTGGLNPGLLWIWAGSARPVLNTTAANATDTPNAPNTHGSIQGDGRCLSMLYDSVVKAHVYRGQDCAFRHRYICELAEDKTRLGKETDRIARAMRARSPRVIDAVSALEGLIAGSHV